ncbi:MAG: transcriptional regulator [Desulfurococcales archaeon]|nr:transcriptional regulator [Desulfurococcales archaeon]
MVEFKGLEVDFSHVPIKPTGAKEVRELEIALIIGTLFREDVIKEIMEPREFTTWVDSLAVAAGAVARAQAGYPVSKIAEELGRTETTIRNHLQGKTKAGKLVLETLEMLKRGKLQIAVPVGVCQPSEEVEKVKAELEECKRRVEELEGKLATVKDELKKIIEKI